MPFELAPADQAAITAIVAGLEAAWNAGDGMAFGAFMAEDADFVTIRAEHYRGRHAIAGGHAAILQAIYAGSKARYTIESARLLGTDVAVVHVRSVLDAPTGPLAGRHEALFSAVLTRGPGGWSCLLSQYAGAGSGRFVIWRSISMTESMA